MRFRSTARRAVLAAVTALLGLSLVLVSTPAEAAKYDVSSGPNTSKRVILTYDDCPRSLKAFKRTVRAAEKLNVGLALFPTGACIRAGKFDAAYARRHGHYVFNHSVTHADLSRLSYARVKRELSAPGVVTNYGRPPYGASDATVRRAYRAKGMRMWLWDVDTNDWRGKSRASVVRYVVRNSRKGDTVLMHLQWNGFSGTAIRQMKAGLAKRGIKLCRNYVGTTPRKPAGSLPC